MSIKMIISDLDGTLFNSDEVGYEVSQKLIERIDDFKKSGKIFTIATGRPQETCLKVVEKLRIEVPYIVYNGAKIVDKSGNEIYSEGFFLKIWLPFLQKLQKIGASIVFYHGGQVLCLKYTEEISIYEKKEITKCSVADETLLFSDIVINKILIIGNVKKYILCWQELDLSIKNEFKYVVSEDNYFEIVKSNVSKGSALKQLKAYLDINHDEVVGIGNHMNDKELIEEAFVGVAVANAVEALKNVADFVTAGKYEEGVIEVIERFM